MANAASSPAEAENTLSAHAVKFEELLPMSIPSALNLFLVKLDQCRQLITASQSRTGTTNKLFDFGLSARDRKVIDEALKAYWKDVENALKQLDEEIMSKASDIGLKPEHFYPFAAEMDAAAFKIFYGKVAEEALERHIAELNTEDPAKVMYFVMNASNGPHNSATSILGESLVPLIVSEAEEFLAALVRTGISLYPNALGEPPTIPNEIYKRYRGNLVSSDIERWQADQKVKAFIKGSPSDWRKSMRQWARIDIGQLGADWDMIVELVQRRHVIIHNGSRVDNEYLQNIAEGMRRGLILGARLVSDSSYLIPVIFEVETWAICLAFLWAKHFFKEKSIYGPDVNERAMELAAAGRWSQALAVLDSYLTEPTDSAPESVLFAKINRAFCLQELGRDNDVLRREIELLEMDATNEGFQKISAIGKYALLRDYPSLIENLQHVLNDKNNAAAGVLRNALRTSPLIKRAMAESSQVRKLLFGTPAKRPQPKGSSTKTGSRQNKSEARNTRRGRR